MVFLLRGVLGLLRCTLPLGLGFFGLSAPGCGGRGSSGGEVGGGVSSSLPITGSSRLGRAFLRLRPASEYSQQPAGTTRSQVRWAWWISRIAALEPVAGRREPRRSPGGVAPCLGQPGLARGAPSEWTRTKRWSSAREIFGHTPLGIGQRGPRRWKKPWGKTEPRFSAAALVGEIQAEGSSAPRDRP